MKLVKVTERYQVTIPKEIREKVGLRPGMLVGVEARGEREIVIVIPEGIRDPLKVLVGEKPLLEKELPVEELEELIEG